MPDVQTSRRWVVYQAEGIEPVGERIARAGFAPPMQDSL